MALTTLSEIVLLSLFSFSLLDHQFSLFYRYLGILVNRKVGMLSNMPSQQRGHQHRGYDLWLVKESSQKVEWGNYSALFRNWEHVRSCRTLWFGLPTANKKDIETLQLSCTEGYKDKEGSGKCCMRSYWDAEGNVCSVWRNEVQWLLSPTG